MNAKTIVILVAAGTVSLIVLILLFGRSVPVVKSTQPSAISHKSSIPWQPTTSTPAETAAEAKITSLRALAAKSGAPAVWETLFATPIRFYGKVVDEKGNGVSGATAICSPTQTMDGTNPDVIKLSSQDGSFTLDTHGLAISVRVKKDGYYSDSNSYGTFNYVETAGATSEHSTPDNPAIFKLRKVGDTIRLIETQGAYGFSSDGTPVYINLHSGKLDSKQGDMEVSVWVDDGGQKHSPPPYDWKVDVSVPGGGVLDRNGVYDFQAPVSDYDPKGEFAMTKNLGVKWRESETKDYFLHLPNDCYARIQLSVGASGHFFHYTAYLNPIPNSSNLETDSSKVSQIR